jgi:catechol 2,3-dioxygenase-like lactoylglutathione lyase family enzyme
MALTAVVPNIFYDDLDIGVAFFCDALGFRNAYRADDDGLCIVRRDGACFHLCVNAEVAKQDRPEFRIATDDIEAYHREIVARASRALHPNGRTVTDKAWGLREFALLDPTGVCVIVEQPIVPA